MKSEISKKLLIFSLYGIAAFPLLPEEILGLPVILLFISSVINFIETKKINFNYKKLFIATIPFILFLFSSFYSDDFSYAFKKVSGTRLSLLVVPLSFFLLKSESIQHIKSNLTKFQMLFSISSLLLCVIYFTYLPFIEPSNNPAFVFPSGFFFKFAVNDIPYFHIEPVYFSFLITLSLINTVHLFTTKKLNSFFFIIIIIIYLSVVFLLVSKIAILFTILFGAWFIFFKLKRKKISIILIILALLIIYPIYQIPSIKYEVEELQYFYKGKKRAKDDSTQQRYRVTKSSLDLAKQVNPLIGTGIGDVQKELNEVYEKNNYEELLTKKFDTHNQFISIFLGVGIIGLLGLMAHLISLIVLAFNKKFNYSLWALLFIILQMFTETVLERQLPVIVYSFLISFILFLPKNLSFNKKRR
ncbi:O-antigen ligase family protein [Psychroflexus sediminis]|uniref:O-antigen ligase like membrane protein n=1 Tax=Psychroflexus sediminis TaxID=470826 RepID=A0A1G7UKB7_9FLAO|nr:O-antigen ligase family protein [Psychroflexus sediminis]SDG47539.1 O-antigen ligase like membrane protein [Psychroflexus sediminis]